MENSASQLSQLPRLSDDEAGRYLPELGFEDIPAADRRLCELAQNDSERDALSMCLPMLLMMLEESASPDDSLLNFQRYVQSVPDREALFRYLAGKPRAVEILVKLFVGSQFLTEILLRRPQALEELTDHKGLSEFKSRQQLVAEAAQLAAAESALDDRLDAVRRFRHDELLRIGACDSFGLLDLRSVTVQLSLLADAIVQSCLNLLLAELQIDASHFVVLAFGKLGGEELNYSSDIDLVFLSDADAGRYWKLGQRLIQTLRDATSQGFLYRVDMRLRPWGRSGALVNTVDAHIEYLRKHGQAWEKQALLKARPIAGNLSIGQDFLNRAEPIIFSTPPAEAIRESVREMKSRIEANLKKQGRTYGEVKSGEGSIRDVEFVTQCLQLIHGRDNPHVRSVNTMGGLTRLGDFGYLEPNEYYALANGYSFLRTVEHALQLLHDKQVHALPEKQRELAYLASRLDFPSSDDFLRQYERHCRHIRQIYAIYVEQIESSDRVPSSQPDALPDLRLLMASDYQKTFSDDEILRHAELLKILSADNLVHIDAALLEQDRWQLTIVGYNHPGELSLMCGLLFVYGFNILDGNVFTAKHVADHQPSGTSSNFDVGRQFVNVFIVTATQEVKPEVWRQYRDELADLVGLVRSNRAAEAHGNLAKRVAGGMQIDRQPPTRLLPVTVNVDNEAHHRTTVLHIEADDTIGFLYELASAMALAGIEIEAVFVRLVGKRVADTLFVTDADGQKITDTTRLRELRAAIVLIKHFTHLLPHSPNPESALLHFRDFLEHLFDKSDWMKHLTSLERPDVLQALAKLLGVSNFLWEDFLRLQHDNLFPVVANVEDLKQAKTKEELCEEFQDELQRAADEDERRIQLNRFKDREMFRIDMRHILGHSGEFGQFAQELTDLAEAVVIAAYKMCDDQLRSRYGLPRVNEERVCPLSICALGKCGGRELGFASDIELMFICEDNGRTTGPEVITTTEYFLKLVESITKTILARDKGIFQLDLRLRPYGRAGSLAVSLDAFRTYFQQDGAAWPYERQALVKLRPIAGDASFGQRIVDLRDALIYTGEPFDVVAMRAMREKQVRQLVQAGTFNAKLSAGGLVDCEYLVQGLQITHGHQDALLRTRSTRKAIVALMSAGILSQEQHDRLMAAYIFLRQLIDALRMVRGNARDLTLPDIDDEEFQFLARRLGYGHDKGKLQADVERHTHDVTELGSLLDANAPDAYGEDATG